MEGEHNNAYHRYLVDFMGFRDGVTYTRDTEFDEATLVLVVPEDILMWMRQRTFGMTTIPAAEDKVDFLIRSSTLEVMKKAISWYMPERVSDQRQLTILLSMIKRWKLGG